MSLAFHKRQDQTPAAFDRYRISMKQVGNINGIFLHLSILAFQFGQFCFRVNGCIAVGANFVTGAGVSLLPFATGLYPATVFPWEANACAGVARRTGVAGGSRGGGAAQAFDVFLLLPDQRPHPGQAFKP